MPSTAYLGLPCVLLLYPHFQTPPPLLFGYIKVGEESGGNLSEVRTWSSVQILLPFCCFSQKKAVAAGGDTDDLQARLDNLRRGDDD